MSVRVPGPLAAVLWALWGIDVLLLTVTLLVAVAGGMFAMLGSGLPAPGPTWLFIFVLVFAPLFFIQARIVRLALRWRPGSGDSRPARRRDSITAGAALLLNTLFLFVFVAVALRREASIDGRVSALAVSAACHIGVLILAWLNRPRASGPAAAALSDTFS